MNNFSDICFIFESLKLFVEIEISVIGWFSYTRILTQCRSRTFMLLLNIQLNNVMYKRMFTPILEGLFIGLDESGLYVSVDLFEDVWRTMNVLSSKRNIFK